MQSRAKLIIFVLLVVLTVPLVRIMLSEREPPQPQPVENLHIPNRGNIQITAYWTFGQNLGLWYRTFPESENHDPDIDPALEEHTRYNHDRGAFFGTLTPPIPYPKFALHHAEDGHVVAVALQWAPNEILILHDFAADQSWPDRQPHDTIETMADKGQDLLDRLQQELPEAEHLQLHPAQGMRYLPRPEPVVP